MMKSLRTEGVWAQPALYTFIIINARNFFRVLDFMESAVLNHLMCNNSTRFLHYRNRLENQEYIAIKDHRTEVTLFS